MADYKALYEELVAQEQKYLDGLKTAVARENRVPAQIEDMLTNLANPSIPPHVKQNIRQTLASIRDVCDRAIQRKR